MKKVLAWHFLADDGTTRGGTKPKPREIEKALTPGHGFNSERSQRAENGGRP